MGPDESEPVPKGQRSQNPCLGVGRGRNLIFGVGAHALGSDEAETSSSELDEAWPGLWGSDEAKTSSSELRP